MPNVKHSEDELKEMAYVEKLRLNVVSGNLKLEDITPSDAVLIYKYEPFLKDDNYEIVKKFCISRFDMERDAKSWRFKAFMSMITYGAYEHSKFMKHTKLKKIKKLIASALITVFIALTSTQIYGKADLRDYFDAFTDKVKEVFIFVGNIADNRKSVPYKTLKKVPKGYERIKYYEEELNSGFICVSDYIDSLGNKFALEVKKYNNSNWSNEIETNGYVKEFKINENTYYKSSNYEYNKIFWKRGDMIYIIYGIIPTDELQDIVILNEG